MPKQATVVLIALAAYAATSAMSFELNAFTPIGPTPADRAVPLPASPPPGAAPEPMAPRTSIPVAQKLIADQGGERVYTVPIRFGSKVVESVIDTEDTATQILPSHFVATDFVLTLTDHSMTYDFGGSYAGRLMRGRVAIGSLGGAAEVAMVDRAGCEAAKPKCAIVDEPVESANFGFDSTAASLGLAPTRDPAHPSLPVQLGAKRYLLLAPRTDENGRTEPGQLVLNPTDDETLGFVPLTMDPAAHVPNAVHGCMRNLVNQITFCGAIIFDSDYSGITVFQQKDLPNRRDWKAGDKVKLFFTDATNAHVLAGVDFTVGLSTLPLVAFGKPGLYRDPVIIIGQVPYLGLEVMTDLTTGQISVGARKTKGADAVGYVP